MCQRTSRWRSASQLMKSKTTFILLLILSASLAFSTTMKSVPLFRKVPNAKLGVSEPNPSWFGNKANEASNPTWTNKNWLKSRFHFSFAEYSNPRNTGFGVLRVMNDDLVQPDRGFGEHPHRDAEICTYIVRGKLTHQDSMGTSETLGRGAIQFMTAGSGVSHSEYNLDKTNPLRFIQIWLNPRSRGVRPNYGSFPKTVDASLIENNGTCTARENTWSHLVSDNADTVTNTPIKINQDANIHVTEVFPGHSVDFELKEGRQAYLLCIEGSATFTGLHGEEHLEQHDAAELFGPNVITATPSGDSAAHMLLVEMKYAGIGRTDL